MIERVCLSAQLQLRLALALTWVAAHRPNAEQEKLAACSNHLLVPFASNSMLWPVSHALAGSGPVSQSAAPVAAAISASASNSMPWPISHASEDSGPVSKSAAAVAAAIFGDSVPVSR